MSKKDIEDFASTKHKGLPNKIEAKLEELIKKIDEKWSDKYKKSIDCNNPKGFSQKSFHCESSKKGNNMLLKKGSKGPSQITTRIFRNRSRWYLRKGYRV